MTQGGDEGQWWPREMVTKGSGDEGSAVTLGNGWWRREVVTKGSGDEGSVVTFGKWWRRECGDFGKWWLRAVVAKGSGDEGKWWRREVVTKGSGDSGTWWRREVVTKGSGAPTHEKVWAALRWHENSQEEHSWHMGRHETRWKELRCEVWRVQCDVWGKCFLDVALHRGRAQVMFLDNNAATASHKARTHRPGWRTAHARSCKFLCSSTGKWFMKA